MTLTAPTLVEPTQGDRRVAATLGTVLADDNPLVQAIAHYRIAIRSAVVEECAAICDRLEGATRVATKGGRVQRMVFEHQAEMANALATAIRKLKESDNAG